jgi:predicted transcriptional regulator
MTVEKMELPSHLKKLLPDALDILRHLYQADDMMSDIDEICEAVGLSERGFGKHIRRLVTAGYVIMDGNQIYRLTDKGSEVSEELAEYDANAPEDDDDDDESVRQYTRRLIVALPRTLQVAAPARVIVGISPEHKQLTSAEVVTRLSVLHGEPTTPQETIFELDGDAATQDFLVTAGHYSRARVKVEVYQLGPNPGDIAVAGGLYVDVDVAPQGNDDLAVYGADITIEDHD